MTLSELGSHASLRKLLAHEAPLLAQHYLRLDAESRRLRFLHGVNDEFVVAHAGHAADPGSIVYVIVVDGVVRAAAELKRIGEAWGRNAEAAFSVEPEFANRGFATELMGRIIRSARNRGIRRLVMTCLAENTKMQAIARRHSADLHLEQGDVTADIIPPRADYISFATEAFEDRFVMILSFLDLHDRKSNEAA